MLGHSRQFGKRLCARPQCSWQGLTSQRVTGQPLLVKREDDARSPDCDVAMQRAELTIGILTRILVLQLHEHGLDRPLRLSLEPAAKLIPHQLERVLARPIRAWPQRLFL